MIDNRLGCEFLQNKLYYFKIIKIGQVKKYVKISK